MADLTQRQVEAVIDWMNTWDQLRGTAIPIRFREDWERQLKTVDSKTEKPPLGLKPKRFHDRERQIEIMAAMARYQEANKPIPKEWAIEFASYCE